jgi:multidrug efflux pump subunit AcrA (membrane-fusion protein)
VTGGRPHLFRPEAEAARQAPSAFGVPLFLTPGWVGKTYWILLAITAAALLFAAFAQVGEFARGPAVVRALGRREVVTRTGGIVIGVDVQTGMQVRAGQPLVRFQADVEEQELQQLDRELEARVVRLLLFPEDEGARQAIGALQGQREIAARRLKDRQLIAPQAGVVRSLRIRPGQMLAPGDLVLTLVDETVSQFSVIALVPGQFRPFLRPGMTLRFDIEGYQLASSDLRVESVGDEIVGPNEVRRYLGRELGDAIDVQGPMVLVRARLPAGTFTWRGQSFRFYDGIPGHVDVRIRTLRLAAMLFPALDEMK